MVISFFLTAQKKTIEGFTEAELKCGSTENLLLVVLSAAIFFKITDAILICPPSLLKCPVHYHNALLVISDGRVVLNNKLRLQEGGVRWEINKLTKLSQPLHHRGVWEERKEGSKERESDCLS